MVNQKKTALNNIENIIEVGRLKVASKGGEDQRRIADGGPKRSQRLADIHHEKVVHFRVIIGDLSEILHVLLNKSIVSQATHTKAKGLLGVSRGAGAAT